VLAQASGHARNSFARLESKSAVAVVTRLTSGMSPADSERRHSGIPHQAEVAGACADEGEGGPTTPQPFGVHRDI